MYNIFGDFERGFGKIVCLGENFVDRGGNLGDFFVFLLLFFWVGAKRKKFLCEFGFGYDFFMDVVNREKICTIREGRPYCAL